MLVHHFLESSAQRTPETIALIEPTRSIAYGDLDRQANAFAHVLIDSGLRRRDRVVIAMETSIDMAVAYFGAMKAGAVAVPLPHGPKSDRLCAAIADCEPAACVLDERSAVELEAENALREVRRVFVDGGRRSNARRSAGAVEYFRQAIAGAETTPVETPTIDLDLAAIIYTSGSTGAPRGVMLTHRNIVANTRSILEYLELTAADRVMCVLPFYYVYGLSLLHTHVAVGGSVVIDTRFAFPNVVLEAMTQREVTGFAGVPSTFALLLHRSNLTKMQFPHLRYVTQAGGGMPPARVQEWLERGPQVPFFVMYGATEASARLTYLPPADLRRKLGSIGVPIPNVAISVLRDDGTVADPGETGELVARGSNIAKGYWRRPDETHERFGEHTFRTGDLGYQDDEGFLYVVGRRHDMIKIGGNRVGAKEIEDVLQEHPDVHEAAVVGVPDEILGEVPVAFVALKQSGAIPADALVAFCGARLAKYKVPARVIFERELPKLQGIGKPDKAALRLRVASACPVQAVR